MAEAFFPVLPIAEVAEGLPVLQPIGSGLTDEDGNASGMITDMDAQALYFLIYRYQNKPRIADFIKAFTGQFAELEEALWQLYTERTLDTAEGVQLDGLGAIVGEPRKGRSDSVYRQFIRVRILVNLSDGDLPSLYAILLAALGVSADYFIRQYNTAIVIHLDSDTSPLTAAELLVYLREAKAAGVGIGINYAIDDVADSFLWGSVNDGSLVSLTQGFGSLNDAGLGGNLSSFIRA